MSEHLDGQSMPPHHVVSEKLSCRTQSFVQNAHHPRKYAIVEKPNVALVVEGSIQHHQFTPPTMVDGTPYFDWRATITMCGLDAHIYMYQFLPLLAAHTSTTITEKQCGVRFITRDKVTQCLGSQLLCVLLHIRRLPAMQSKSGALGRMLRPIASRQKPLYNARNWQSPPKSSDHVHAQTMSRDETIVPRHSDLLSVFPGCDQTPPTSTPPLMLLTNASAA